MAHYWVIFIGSEKEFVWRFLAVIFGTLTVAISFITLSKVTSHTKTALLSTVFIAVNPFFVAYSRENRMYSLLGFIGLISVYLLIKLLSTSDGNTTPLLLLSLINLSGIFIHYLFSLLIVVEWIAIIIFVFYTQKNHMPHKYYVLETLAAMLFPFTAITVWILSGKGTTSTASSLLSRHISGAFLWHLWLSKLRVIGIDFVLSEPPVLFSKVPYIIKKSIDLIWITWLIGMLFTIRETLKLKKGNVSIYFNVIFPIIWFIIPVLLIAPIPRGAPGRFFIDIAPVFALFTAAGIYFPWKYKWSRVFSVISVALLIITISWFAKWKYTTPPSEFNVAADYVKENAREGDLVLLLHPLTKGLADYYLRGVPVDIKIFPTNFRQPTPEDAQKILPRLLHSYKRIWVGPVDPGTTDQKAVVDRWLSRNTFQIVKKWFPSSLYVSLYLPPNEVGDRCKTPEEFDGLNVRFDNILRLKNACITRNIVEAGAGIGVIFNWEILSNTKDYVLIDIDLKDQEGRTWSKRLSPMIGGHLTSSMWKPKEVITDRHGIWISEGTPPGMYKLQVSVYDATTHKMIGKPVVLQDIKVLPGRDPTPVVKADVILNEHLKLLGSDKLPPTITQGHYLPITLYWEPLTSNISSVLCISLITRDFFGRDRVITQTKRALGYGWYPEKEWKSHVYVKGMYSLKIPGRLSPGTYRVSICLNGRIPKSYTVGRIKVLPIKRSFRALTPEHRINASLKGIGDLIGYNVKHKERKINVTLYWHATQAPTKDYTVFVHIVNSTGKLIAQKDNPPVQGTRPTSTWEKGEYIEDNYSIELTQRVPPGKYDINVGMYDPTTGRRLEAYLDKVRCTNDAVRISSIVLEANKK